MEREGNGRKGERKETKGKGKKKREGKGSKKMKEKEGKGRRCKERKGEEREREERGKKESFTKTQWNLIVDYFTVQLQSRQKKTKQTSFLKL